MSLIESKERSRKLVIRQRRNEFGQVVRRLDNVIDDLKTEVSYLEFAKEELEEFVKSLFEEDL